MRKTFLWILYNAFSTISTFAAAVYVVPTLMALVVILAVTVLILSWWWFWLVVPFMDLLWRVDKCFDMQFLGK